MRWMEGRGEGDKGAGSGWRSDRREDSITRHQQLGAYLVAIGFSLPKASPALYQIVHSRRNPCKTHRNLTDARSLWNCGMTHN